MIKIYFAKTKDSAILPSKAFPSDAGIDLFIPQDFPETQIKPGEKILIPMGIRYEIPEGYALVAFNKSGVATKKGLVLLACCCDCNYRGEVFVSLVNTSDKEVYVSPKDKITQFLLLPVPEVEIVEVDESFLSETDRGAGCLGSTDNKNITEKQMKLF